MKRRQLLQSLAAVSLSQAMTLQAGNRLSSHYLPDRMRLLVPSPVGSGPDLVARSLTEELFDLARLNIAVVNIEGANGELARSRFLSEPADGTTWLFAHDSLLVLNPSFYPRDHDDPLWGLSPVAQVATNFFYILVRQDDPIEDITQWFEAARQTKTPMNYGSGGVGSQHHFFMEELARKLNLNLNHVPYRGNRPAAQGLLRGDIRVLMAGASSMAMVRAGQLRQLAVTAPEPSPDFPGLPALSQYVDGFAATAWFGIFGHRNTPVQMVTEMQTLLGAATATKALRQRLKERGNVTADYLDGAAFVSKIRSDRTRFANIADSYTNPL